jgi:LPPG:FO 2-phospho-L-lactate transferase
MRIVVLAGGIGGARFLTGVRAHARAIGAEVTAIVNVGDDVWMHGLRICPDLDSVMYTLGGGIDPQRQWGRADESWTVKQELAAYGAEPTWFGLGDRDIATHLVRSNMLSAGYPLSAVTAALCARWQPGVTLLPATDERLETHVVVEDADGGGERAIHFQEWWVRHRGEVPTRRFVFVGADVAKPADGVLDALAGADVVLIAPSNPVVSIAPILAVVGLREALVNGAAPIIGLSPIIGGSPVRGMADKCLAAMSIECSAQGVGRLYQARSAGGILDGWLVDPVDADTTVSDVQVVEAPLWMTDVEATEAMVRAALALASPADAPGAPAIERAPGDGSAPNGKQ